MNFQFPISNFQSILNFLNSQTPLLYLTQSLWRDEAFAVLMSEPPVAKIISLTAQDFNPPLYYLILHFWMKVFGQGEVAIRLLSFIFHLLLVYVIYKFAQKLKFSRLNTLFLLLTTFFNPMLIYFAFETRMYSLLALLVTASMYCLYTKNWPGYILSSALGLWTQPFMAFILLTQGVYLLLTRTLTRKHFLSLLAIFFLFLPWVPTILWQFSRSGPMWMWPIDLTTVTSILGNLFTDYEGTPWGLWKMMGLLSIIILFFSFFIFKESLKNKSWANFYRLLLCWLFLPVIIVLVISYFKPIYVNRYLIFVSVAEVLVTTIAVSLIKNRVLRWLLATGYLLLLFGFNVWFPPRHAKQDIRRTFLEIKKLARPTDIVLSQTPLTFFEANYYFGERSRVFLYNPEHLQVPYYAGNNLIISQRMVDRFPRYPSRAFLIHDDVSFEIVYQR